jgi:hypothetical protein
MVSGPTQKRQYEQSGYDRKVVPAIRHHTFKERLPLVVVSSDLGLAKEQGGAAPGTAAADEVRLLVWADPPLAAQRSTNLSRTAAYGIGFPILRTFIRRTAFDEARVARWRDWARRRRSICFTAAGH